MLTSALVGGALGAVGEAASIAAPRVIGRLSGALGGADDATRIADDAIGALDDLAPLGERGGAIPQEKIDSFGAHKGIASGSAFFPEEIGLPISPRQLSTDGVRVTNRGVTKVEEHLRRFSPDPQNEAQLQRLRDIAAGKLEPTQADLNNYTHELRESLRYQRLGYSAGQQPTAQDAAYQLWNNLHTATLEDYGFKEGPGVLYHPSVETTY